MYHFEIHTNGEAFEKGRPDDFGKIKNLLISIRAEGLIDKAEYFVKGKQVDFDTIFEVANAKQDEYFSKRRMISWKEGDCENTRRYKWILK